MCPLQFVSGRCSRHRSNEDGSHFAAAQVMKVKDVAVIQLHPVVRDKNCWRIPSLLEAAPRRHGAQFLPAPTENYGPNLLLWFRLRRTTTELNYLWLKCSNDRVAQSCRKWAQLHLCGESNRPLSSARLSAYLPACICVTDRLSHLSVSVYLPADPSLSVFVVD